MMRFGILLFMVIGVMLPQKAQANPKYASLVIDAGTGEVLHASRADTARYPASLTKMMTLYMVFEALDSGKLRKSTRLKVSYAAAKQPPSKLRLRVGSTVSVEDAIYALVTKSANDVAAVVAERLGQTESGFARLMTAKARRLGMTKTTFRNASGLPDRRQKTTARDIIKLSLALLRDFPHHYHYFSTRHWRYRGVSYRNHNKLLASYAGMDGFKTGYINASGYNLVASAVRNGRRVIGVVFGGRSGRTRDQHMARLLDKAFLTPARGKGSFVVAGDAGIRRARLPQGLPKPKPLIAKAPMASPQAAPKLSAALSPPSMPSSMPLAKPNVLRQPSTVVQKTAAPALTSQPVPARNGRITRHVALGGDLTGLEKTRSWGIQVGAFTRYAPAHLAVTQAARSLPHILMRTHVAIIPVDRDEGTLYRARLIGLEKSDSKEACRLLRARRVPCMPFQTSAQSEDKQKTRS